MSIKASVGLDLNDAINYMGQSMQVNLDNLSLDPNDASKNLRGTFRPYHL